MTLYARQQKYFEKAYETGQHGWPVIEPTAFVVRSMKQLIHDQQLQKGSPVLDLGCGEGRHTFASAELGLRAIGIDYQAMAIARARVMPKAKSIDQGYSFLIGDAFHLPFRNKTFDLIIDCGCFHHVKKSDTNQYLDNLLSLLSRGGHFILSCFSSKFRHHPTEKRKRDWLVHSGHYDRFFKEKDIKKIFGEHFEILNIEEETSGLYSFYLVMMEKKT